MIFFFSSKVIIAFPAMINPIIQITLPPAVILVFMKPVNILITVAIIPQIQIIIKPPNLFISRLESFLYQLSIRLLLNIYKYYFLFHNL